MPLTHELEEQIILLADRGFLLNCKGKKSYLHRHKGRVGPENVQICGRGEWKARRLIETVFGLFTQVLRLKHLSQRQFVGVKMRVAFAIAVYNTCTS